MSLHVHVAPFRRRRCRAGLLLAALSAMTIPARAMPPLDPQTLTKQFAALLAGHYSAACPIEQALVPITIAGDGRITDPDFSMAMFDPGAQFVLGKFTQAHPQFPDGFHYSLEAANLRVELQWRTTASRQGSLAVTTSDPAREIRFPSCSPVDWDHAHLAQDKADFQALLMTILGSGADPFPVRCRPVSGRGAEHTFRIRLTQVAVQIGDVILPLDDTLRPVTQLALGGRYADGTLNGSVWWRDGWTFHAERKIDGTGYATVSFGVPTLQGVENQFCRPAD